MSNRKRRPAHRAEPVRAPRGARVAAHRAEPERSPLAARVHDLTPARLAQGGVVAVLVAGLCTTITAQASASGNETDSGRTAAMAEARDGAVDVAADALVVADAVQIKAAHTTGVSAAKLAELRTAAAQVDALITEAEGRTSTTSDTRDAGDTTSADAPAASASPSATAQPSATSSPSATASSVPAASADTAASDAASPAASPAAASAGSDDNAAAAGADPATDTATVAPSTLATSTAGHAVGATVPGATVAGTAKAAPPAPATASTAAASASTAAASASPTSTATAGTPTPTGTPTAATGTTTPQTSPTGASSTAFDAKVPTIPDTGGPEDQTTEDLRTAVAHLATIAAEVRAEVADETARQAADQAAADQAAADKAAAQKAAAKKAADKAAADKAAAEKAAERKAAQRAAWKKSLQGFPNGRIPASALCGVPFDSSVLLRCDAAQALTALDKAYTRAFGHHLEVSDSYRSYGAQVSCRATKGYLCAEPGTSNHGWGVAVDLGGGIQSFGTSTHSWMNRNAAKFGWHHPGWAEPGGSKPEPWHWEYTA